MSRGHGAIQRRVVDLLSADEQVLREGLPPEALRPVLGNDRSNRRRVIQSLIRRGDVEEIYDESGERRLKLHGMTALQALVRLRYPGWLEDDDEA